jgi:hypothetical protein
MDGFIWGCLGGGLSMLILRREVGSSLRGDPR